jgi:RNA polymerase sigma-70 factor (TIGR02943 family)
VQQRIAQSILEKISTMKSDTTTQATTVQNASPPEVDSAEVSALRGKMVKFASLQLDDPHLAEDAVQEALMGAYKNSAAFAGRASHKTWVFAILKNKITDILRQRQRQRHGHVSTQQVMGDADESADFTELFDGRGMWEPDERPAAWGNPTETLQDKQFWKVFEICLEGLPGQQARVFMMREYVGLDSHEICVEVGITSTNLNVMLHRSRLRLRACLENRWFVQGGSSC